MAKNNALLNAVQNAAAGREPVATKAAVQAAAVEETVPMGKRQQPSRVGKYIISAWLEEGFKTSLLAIKMKNPRRQTQDMMEEALNLLFEKYNVPVVTKEGSTRPGSPSQSPARATRRAPG